jgi:hypothetical protein
MKYVKKSFPAYSFPQDRDGFVKWLDEQIAEAGVPVDKVSINVSYEDVYGSTDGTLTLEYERPYTPEELEEEGRRKRNNQNWEIEQLRKLKAKYPDA